MEKADDTLTKRGRGVGVWGMAVSTKFILTLLVTNMLPTVWYYCSELFKRDVKIHKANLILYFLSLKCTDRGHIAVVAWSVGQENKSLT